MGGKSKSVTVGYWYDVAFHFGLCRGPIDAFLEFRGGDITAWSGELTHSGTINIDKPNLWGGTKDQGGIVGDVDVMFGEPTQRPNDYLKSTFGDKQPAWRGLSTVVFKGGKYGAMNPYPQKPSVKITKIKHGWDDDPFDSGVCWYPETAAIPLQTLDLNAVDWRYLIVPHDDATDYSAPAVDDSLWQTGPQPFASFHDLQSSYWQGVASHGFQTAPGTETGQNVKLWMRADVYVASATGTLAYDAWKDNQMAMWFNGHKVIDQTTTNGGYVSGSVDASFLVPGKNSVVVMARDNEASPSVNNWFYIGVRVNSTITQNAMNPAHLLYYARTQQHMGRTPVSAMNDASFRTAADWYFSQSFGLCTTRDDSQESTDAFIARICKVAGCAVTYSSAVGQWFIDIANGVYDFDSLPILTDDDILDFSVVPTTLDGAVNSVSVQYQDIVAKQQVSTPPAQAMGLIAAFGTIHQDTAYPEIPSASLAARVAQRDLLQTAKPTNAYDLTTSRVTYAWRRNMYFRLQSAKRGIADMVCIVGDIDTGTLKSGAIKISAMQDVYSLPSASFVQQETGIDTRPSQIPTVITQSAVFEAPYIELARALSGSDLSGLPVDAGYLEAVAADPATDRDFTLTTSSDGGTTYTGNASGDWCPTALIVEGDTLSGAAPATAFTLASGVQLARVAVGSAALWGAEIVRVDAIDATAGTLTLGRGCADTVPAPHAANARIWFFDGFEATDGVQYGASETIDVKLLTNTGSQQLDPALAAAVPLTFVGRASLPYPPGKLLIGGNPYPTAVAGTFAVTWADRNRIVQADKLIDASAAAVAAADNTRYHLKFADSTGATLVERTDIYPATASVVLNYTGNVTLTLSTIDDTGESLQKHSVTFAYTPPTPAPGASAITATTYTPVYDGIIYDGGSAGTGT